MLTSRGSVTELDLGAVARPVERKLQDHVRAEWAS